MAEAMGIPVSWVYTTVFAIGAGMAAASGVLFGPLVGVNHAMGVDWVLKAFIVVVVGGMGNLGGSIAASIFISLLEAYASIWVSPAQAVIVSFVVLILTLLFRPTGLFVPTEKERRPTMRAVVGQQTDSAIRVAERNQVFAKQAHPQRIRVWLRKLVRQQRWHPVAPQRIAHRCAWPHTRDQLIVLTLEHVSPPLPASLSRSKLNEG